MRKIGFTLAEVLITLAIVGIIAALTIPGLSRNVSQKTIGPTLAKAINNLNTVNKEALDASGRTSLDSIDSNYIFILETYMTGMRIRGNTSYLSNDGISYSIPKESFETITLTPDDGTDCSKLEGEEKTKCLSANFDKEIFKERYSGKYWPVTIDINGDKGKNAEAKGYEQFLVYVDSFGRVVLAGGEEAELYGATGAKNLDCTTATTKDEHCTATVAKYNWEVTY